MATVLTAVSAVTALLVSTPLGEPRAPTTETSATSPNAGGTPRTPPRTGGAPSGDRDEAHDSTSGPSDGSGDGRVRVLGDGSTSDTGPQPDQLTPRKLAPGEKPPQFVVFSWDGALEGDDRMFSSFRRLAKENDAHMTFFLTGMYLLPKAKRQLYRPPQHRPGSAAISFATDAHIVDTLRQLSTAWQDGNEIGTHFNGHFCGAKGGGDWSTAEWKSEIEQAYSFVRNWKTNTGEAGLPPLPFDYDRELVGGRAPCLEGQRALLPAARSFGWRYDASSAGDFQIWPTKVGGIWDFPLQLVPYPGRDLQVLSMDFNFLYQQSGDDTEGDPAKYREWQRETRDGYLSGFERVYHGNRAPFFIGNHFEDWNGGIYMRAVADVVRDVCRRTDVRCVSFRELADWLDAQDPRLLRQLRELDPAESPDWSRFAPDGD